MSLLVCVHLSQISFNFLPMLFEACRPNHQWNEHPKWVLMWICLHFLWFVAWFLRWNCYWKFGVTKLEGTVINSCMSTHSQQIGRWQRSKSCLKRKFSMKEWQEIKKPQKNQQNQRSKHHKKLGTQSRTAAFLSLVQWLHEIRRSIMRGWHHCASSCSCLLVSEQFIEVQL